MSELKTYEVELTFAPTVVEVVAVDEEDAQAEALGQFRGLELLGAVAVEKEQLPEEDAPADDEEPESFFDDSSDELDFDYTDDEPFDFDDEDPDDVGCNIDLDDEEDEESFW